MLWDRLAVAAELLHRGAKLRLSATEECDSKDQVRPASTHGVSMGEASTLHCLPRASTCTHRSGPADDRLPCVLVLVFNVKANGGSTVGLLQTLSREGRRDMLKVLLDGGARESLDDVDGWVLSSRTD